MQSVWILSSPTYTGEEGDALGALIGVFPTKEDAERWAREATPPVLRAEFVEWHVPESQFPPARVDPIEIVTAHLERALVALEKVDNSREKSLAITKVQEAQHWLAHSEGA